MSELNCPEPGVSAAVIDVCPDTPYTELVRWLASDCTDVDDSTGHAFDVYVRQTQHEAGSQPIYDEVGAFATIDEAIRAADKLAREYGIPIYAKVREGPSGG